MARHVSEHACKVLRSMRLSVVSVGKGSKTMQSMICSHSSVGRMGRLGSGCGTHISTVNSVDGSPVSFD